MDEVMPYVDYLIGNESEALAYAGSHDWAVSRANTLPMRLM